MTKKWFIILMLYLFTFTVVVEAIDKAKEGSPPLPKNEGKILLDHIISGFRTIAISGKGGYQTVNELLQKSMSRLRKAKEEKTVDSVFYRRYKRILEILKLSIIGFKHDREGILNDLIARQIQNFVFDITGETRDFTKPKSRGIGAISEAVSFELLNLHIYLDSRKNRPELIKKYFTVPPPPPPSKKKKK